MGYFIGNSSKNSDYRDYDKDKEKKKQSTTTASSTTRTNPSSSSVNKTTSSSSGSSSSGSKSSSSSSNKGSSNKTTPITASDLASNIIKISQKDYDTQQRMIASDPTISFSTYDIRNPNVQVGSYDNTPSINPITGKSESGGMYYRTGTGGGNFLATDAERQRGIAAAKAGGYGDISNTYSRIDEPTWLNIMRIGGKDIAYDVASGKTPISNVNSLIPTPRPVMVGGVDTSPQNNSYNKDFLGIYGDALKGFGYGDDVISTVPTQLTSPYAFTGYAAEYAYGKDQGMGDSDAHNLALMGRQDLYKDLPSYYDRETGDKVLSATTLKQDTALLSIGINPYTLKPEDREYAYALAREKGLINDD